MFYKVSFFTKIFLQVFFLNMSFSTFWFSTYYLFYLIFFYITFSGYFLSASYHSTYYQDTIFTMETLQVIASPQWIYCSCQQQSSFYVISEKKCSNFEVCMWNYVHDNYIYIRVRHPVVDKFVFGLVLGLGTSYWWLLIISLQVSH